MPTSLDTLTIKGFKSIQSLENLELKDLNILIGGNGAGKSNLIDFFRLMRMLAVDQLHTYIQYGGGISDFLFNGRKTTHEIEFSSYFGTRGYRFKIRPGASENYLLTNEARYYAPGQTGWWELGDSPDGKSLLVKEATDNNDSHNAYSRPVYDAICAWQIYHFHDTSATAPMRHYEIIQDNQSLRFNAANIAPYLYHLKTAHPKSYQEIIDTVRLAIPFFHDFLLIPTAFGEKQKVNLSWHQRGSDYPLQPYHLSDGSIRFICLITALLQPTPPPLIIIDEPELGLHPAAIAILSEAIESARHKTQVLIATQSPAILDHFEIKDIVVVDRHQGASRFQRLQATDFEYWLNSYSVGELWQKNVLPGNPAYE